MAMSEEEIRRTWEEGARKVCVPGMDELGSLLRRKKETALERLAARYKKFSFLGVAMILCSFGWMLQPHLIPDMDNRWRLAVVMMCYFASCAIIDNWLYRGISSIDCYTMTVKEVSEKAMYYRKKHLQSMMVLFPFAVMVVGMIAYTFVSERYMLYGIAAGVFTGFFMGYFQFREFMKEYKILRD